MLNVWFHWCWCSVVIFISQNLQIRAFFDNTGFDTTPRQKIDATSLGLRFEGNKSAPNYFKLLERDGDSLLIGARNVVYNISIETFDVQTVLSWPSDPEDVILCTMKGKLKDDCHNYIRILAKHNETGILVCGTNSFKPYCRIYVYKDGAYVQTSNFSASGITPYDPSHNSTFFYNDDYSEIYSGTVADFAGTDALISKRKITKPEELGLRTERSDIKCLNEPNFVSSFADNDHIYFWFRENAVEYMNCGKAIYSRVARVCKNDRGGPRAYSDSWTTFLKARLNCSLPGEYPFYFDEIAATSGLVTGRDGESDLIYAVFNTPYSALRGSAVCAFSLKEMRKIFRYSPFKTQHNPDSNWLPLMRTQVPQPRPGDCETDSRLLTDEAMNFVRKNSLLDEVVPNHFSRPLIVQTGFKRFTHIAVDSQVIAVDNKKYDVIFIATDDGKVLKLVNLAEETQTNSPVSELMQIFNVSVSINNMLIYRPDPFTSLEPKEGRLVVVSDEEIRSVPLFNCQNMKNCYSCVQLQDPYCAWDTLEKACVGSSIGNWTSGRYLQNLTSGISLSCFAESSPEFLIPDSFPAFNKANFYSFNQNKTAINASTSNTLCKCASFESYANQLPHKIGEFDNDLNVHKGVVFASSEKITPQNLYTIESLIIWIVVTMLISLLAGLIGGLRLSKYTMLLKWPKKDFLKNKNNQSGPFTTAKKSIDKKNKQGKSRDHVTQGNGHVIHANGSLRPACLSVNSPPINAYNYEPPLSMNIFGGPPHSGVHPGLSSYDNEVCPIYGDHDVDIKLCESSGMNPNTNYSTLPKDYKVKKTYL